MAKPTPVQVAKDTMTTTIISAAGKLNAQQFNEYVRLVQDKATFIRDVRMQIMKSHTAKIESLEFGGRITRKATEGVAIADEERGQLAASKVELIATKIQAEVGYTYELAQDSLLQDRNAFNAMVRDRLGERFALDWDDLVVNGDTANTGDPLLKSFDGVIKHCETNVIDMTLNEQTVTDDVFYAGYIALPSRYRRDKPSLRFYCNSDVITAYNKYLAGRETSLGDIRTVDGTDRTTWNGIELFEVSCFPDGYYLLTSKNNVVVGIYEIIETYSDEQPSAGVTLFGQRVRTDVKYVEEAATVLYKGLSPASGVVTV